MTHKDKEPMNETAPRTTDPADLSDLGDLTDLSDLTGMTDAEPGASDLGSTDLDEMELHDLLKDHAPSEMPGPQAAGRKAEPQQTATVSSPRRRARKRAAAAAARRRKMLLQGLAGAFAIAFIIGLGSLCMRAAKAGDYEAELDALEADYASLSAQNEQMKRDNEELSLKVYNLEHNLLEVAGSNEYIEGEAAGSDAEAQMLSGKLEAYTLLVKAQEALIQGDRDTLKSVMSELSKNYDYLDDNAMEAYYTITEQMEQPSLGE